MKGNSTHNLAILFGVMLFSALIGTTLLSCDDSWELVASAYLSAITITDETGHMIGGSDEDWGCEPSNDPDAEFLWCLYPASPNPAQGRTIISFSIPVACHVKIAIHNVYKGHVETLVDRDFEQPGPRQTEWDASSYNSGLYWCYMWAGDFECKGRILIIQ